MGKKTGSIIMLIIMLLGIVGSMIGFASAENDTDVITLNSTFNNAENFIVNLTQNIEDSINLHDWTIYGSNGVNVINFRQSQELQIEYINVISNEDMILDIKCVELNDKNSLCNYLIYNQHNVIEKNKDIIRKIKVSLDLPNLDKYSSELEISNEEGVTQYITINVDNKNSIIDNDKTINIGGKTFLKSEIGVLLAIILIVIWIVLTGFEVWKLFISVPVGILLSFLFYSIF